MKTNAILTILSAFLVTFAILGPVHADPMTIAQNNSKTAVGNPVITVSASEQKFEEVTLLATAQLKSVEGTKDFKKVNHGLRKKAVFGLVPVRVYVLEFLAANPEKLSKNNDGILTSLKEAGPVLLHLTFLRDLPGSTISDAFTESLKANKINTKQLPEDLGKMLGEIKAITQFKKGEAFSIAVSWNDKGSEVILSPNGAEAKTITGGPEFAGQVLSIWFGTPSDSRLEDLKTELIK